jgi:hypothetical protein
MSVVRIFGIAGFLAAAAIVSAAPGHAVGLSAGASSARFSAQDANLVQVQYYDRRVRATNRAVYVNRPVRVNRPVVVNRPVYRANRVATRRAIAVGVGAAAVVGAVAAANARQHYRYQPPYYAAPYGYPAAHPGYAAQTWGHTYAQSHAPVCRLRNEELFNRNGVYRGVFQVRDCR